MNNPTIRFKRSISLFLCLSVFNLGVVVPVVAAPAAATSETSKAATRSTLSMTAGKSRIYKATEAATRVSIADTTVADVTLLNPNEIYVLAKKSGATNIFVWHDQDRMSVVDVNVGVDTGSVRELLTKLMPQEKKLRVLSAGEALVLSGQVSDSLKIQQIIDIAEQVSGKKVMNMMTTEDLPQVLLEVKVAEINRDVAEKLGVQVTGNGFAVNLLNGAANLGQAATLYGATGATQGWLQAQVNNGLVKILAEPNIMAISGQEGQFLSGGQLYIPVPQSSGVGGSVITLQQVNYGIGVRFTPTVLSGNKISLKVRPEVSQPSSNGFTVAAPGAATSVIPQIITRQASTTVQLQDGQTLAIGGLLSENIVEIVSAFPFLANIPVIGALFRSSSFSAGRSELVIIVTPHIVKPLDAKPKLPTDNYKQPSEVEFWGLGQMERGYNPLTGKPNTPPAANAEVAQ